VSAVDPSIQLELRAVAERYASGVDRRDAALIVSAFHADGRLSIHDPAESEQPTAVIVGHDQLGQMAERIARFDRTFHLLGNSRYEVSGDTASGEVYCIAHHLTRDGEPTDYVMYIRYQDEYRRSGDSRWRITARRLFVDWTDVQPVTLGHR
jgi:SnoaL-like domain